jgi:hypothetical protein
MMMSRKMRSGSSLRIFPGFPGAARRDDLVVLLENHPQGIPHAQFIIDH